MNIDRILKAAGLAALFVGACVLMAEISEENDPEKISCRGWEKWINDHGEDSL